MQSTHVGEARGSIWRLADGDIETVVAFSVAAWAPVFASLKTELGSEIFGATFPDWRSSQAAGVEAVCTAPGKDVWVAVAEDRPVGFTLCASTCRVRISHSEPSIMYVSSPTRSEPRATTSAGASLQQPGTACGSSEGCCRCSIWVLDPAVSRRRPHPGADPRPRSHNVQGVLERLLAS